MWLVPAILLIVLFALCFFEWFRVHIIADPRDLAQYPFGSTEGPIEGDTKYQSVETYTQAMLHTWVTSIALALVFVVGGWRKSSRLIVGAYLALAIVVGMGFPNAL